MLMRKKLIVTTGNPNLNSLFNCQYPNACGLKACLHLLEIIKNGALSPADINKATLFLLLQAPLCNSPLPPIICGRSAGLWRGFHMGRRLMNRLAYKHRLISPTWAPEEDHKWQLFKFSGKLMTPKEAVLIRLIVGLIEESYHGEKCL